MKNINELSAREALGLPDYHKTNKIQNYESHFQNMRFKSSDELLAIISSCASDFIERWVAATILGYLGDARINPLSPNLLNIPSATITIGSTLEEIDAAYKTYRGVGVKKAWLMKEYPQHQISLASFGLAKYPVTNYEYLIFLKETHHVYLPTSWRFGIYDPSKANHPVYGILPTSADAYANWLSQKTGRHFRLPTEYEWEYAAGGKEGYEFPWGESYSSRCANTLESNIGSTTPIGLFPEGASPFGCLDMAGNVEEYVSNDYFAYPGGVFVKDDLAMVDNYRVARGGSFTRHSDLARCKRRHGFYNKDIYVMGFRLAETI